MATNTYVALASTTLSVNTTTVTLNSIPQGYTDLILVMVPASSSGTNGIRMRMNGDTNTYYSATYLGGNGSSALSRRETASANMQISSYMGIDTTLGKQVYTLHFMNYSNTTTYKTVLIRNSAGSAAAEAAVGLWTSTAAITSLSFNINTFGASTGDFITESTFTLYGVAAVPQITAKATGGTIYYGADGYVYHKFTGNGTFTPSTALSCDVLTVAGGGGGGNLSAGGGAGGLLYSAAQAVSSAQTVTIGAGGAGGASFGAAAASGVNSSFGSLVATGGGASGAAYANGVTGGSGGGAGTFATTGGAATSGQGFAGGTGTSGFDNGGGGGAGGVGGNGTQSPSRRSGDGGVGTSTYSQWGTVTSSGQLVSGIYYLAGGGGGGGSVDNSLTQGVGGYGGGAAGNNNGVGFTGTGNTGGGGGGGGQQSGVTYNGGAGGSGIVIVRYLG